MPHIPSNRAHSYIRRHRPLITARIQFYPAPLPDLPRIISRIEFDPQDLCKKPHIPSPYSGSEVEGFPDHEGGVNSSNPAGQDNHGAAPGSSKTRKIPKPPGEPGRPRSGGFTLEAALKEHGWSDDDAANFILEIREAAQDKLDTSSCFRSQDPVLIQEICDQMASPSRWQVLNNYQNCWPVRSALKLALKYTAEASRRSETKKTTARFRNALMS